MERYQNKYRIQSHRMPQWDYSGDGMYFITLVTQNRECNLGQIKNGVMILSDFGKIVNDEWLKSFEIRDELYLDECVIMPNHLHAIVVINIPGNRMNNMDGGVADGADQTTGGAADGMAGGAGHGVDDMADGAGHVDARPCVSTFQRTIPHTFQRTIPHTFQRTIHPPIKINSQTQIHIIIYGGI